MTLKIGSRSPYITNSSSLFNVVSMILLVCVDALHPGQQFFSHVWMVYMLFYILLCRKIAIVANVICCTLTNGK